MPESRKNLEKKHLSQTHEVPFRKDGASENDVAPGDITPPIIASEALLAGRTEVQIRHRGEIYRLTLTRAGKLILHK